jgi:deazaflavin-dependent oxidoreductase (nitroreductase family)
VARNAFQRSVVRFAGTPAGARIFARVAPPLDRVVFKATGGRATLASWLAGIPVVMLTTTGRRSGRRISTPILAVPEGDAFVMVGSNFGQAHHPAWVHNLRADPRAWVDGREVRAEEVEGPERDRLMALAGDIYPGFPAYVDRAAPRRIAVMRLR